MQSIRIAHISDSHLGYRALTGSDPVSGRNQRSVDIEDAFAWAIDDLLQRDVDLVIHSGDLFHQNRPVFPAIGAAIRQFRKLEKAGIPTYVIGGNHDTPRLRTSGSVFTIMEIALPDVQFFAGYESGQKLIEGLDLAVTLIPHGALTNPEPPAPQPVKNMRNVLVAHGLVVSPNILWHRHEPGEEEEIGDAILLSEFEYIALGHHHQCNRARLNAWYAGSTERIGWGDDSATPGYVVAEIGERGSHPHVEHILIPARPMYVYQVPTAITANRDGVAIAEHVLQWMEDLHEPEAMTRIGLEGVDRPTRRYAEALIRQDAGQLVWSVQVASIGDIASGIAERHADLPTLNLLDQFSAFVAAERDGGRYDGDFAASFSVTGRRELEQAQMAADAQLTSEEF